MQNLKEKINQLLKRLWYGWLLAIHIDTRAIEFNSGIIAIIIGTIVTIPPNDPNLSLLPTMYWGWIYIIWGIFSCIFSTYGPFNPRKYLALIGVYLWLLLSFWLFEGHKSIDKIIVVIFPYIMFAGSSVFTYLGLWRRKTEWRYYVTDEYN